MDPQAPDLRDLMPATPIPAPPPVSAPPEAITAWLWAVYESGASEEEAAAAWGEFLAKAAAT